MVDGSDIGGRREKKKGGDGEVRLGSRLLSYAVVVLNVEHSLPLLNFPGLNDLNPQPMGTRSWNSQSSWLTLARSFTD